MIIVILRYFTNVCLSYLITYYYHQGRVSGSSSEQLGSSSSNLSGSSPKKPPARKAACRNEDPLRGSSLRIGATQRKLAWPLRNNDSHRSRSVNNMYNPHS